MDNVVVLIQPLPDVMNCHQDSVLKRISGCLSTLTPSWKRWNYMMMRRLAETSCCSRYIMILLKLMFHYGCAIECLWWDTWSWLQYWDFRPSQVVSRFYSRQLLVCKHEIAWDSMSINPQNVPNHGFFGWFLGFQTFFENPMDFPVPNRFSPLGMIHDERV